jgi:hypothetical protein
MVFYPTQEEYTSLQCSGIFLAEWYLAQYAAQIPSGTDPLMDFCIHGWRSGKAPNPYFDCAWYLREAPEVARAGINPLTHYLRHGESESRRPALFFDPAWYRKTYRVHCDENALAHFLAHRLSGRVSPMPDFALVPHMRMHPDWAESGTDPFLHARSMANAAPLSTYEILSRSGLFDANFYLLRNPDVREARLDPLEHFCRDGWREGRDPNLYFNLPFYRTQHGEAEISGGNPLAHYYLFGEVQGSKPGPHFEPAWYSQTYDLAPWQSALAHYLKHRRSQRFSPNRGFDVGAYLAAHGGNIGPNRDPFAYYWQHRE